MSPVNMAHPSSAKACKNGADAFIDKLGRDDELEAVGNGLTQECHLEGIS